MTRHNIQPSQLVSRLLRLPEFESAVVEAC
ncbi:MAG: hypothetical protein RJA63_891 [Pseudomonadota bacterium]|jgi:hypothetical protein